MPKDWERKTGDEVISGIHSTNKLLGVMTKEFEDGNHCKTAVVKFLVSGLGEFLRALVGCLSIAEDKESPATLQQLCIEAGLERQKNLGCSIVLCQRKPDADPVSLLSVGRNSYK
eukprot:gene3808-7576_t